MKKAENIVNEIAEFGIANQPFWYVSTNKTLDAIREAQIEAYNEAIEAAAKNAKTKTKRVIATNGYSFNIEEVDIETILKLKK